MSGGASLLPKFPPISFFRRVSRFLRCFRTSGTPIRKSWGVLECYPVLPLNVDTEYDRANVPPYNGNDPPPAPGSLKRSLFPTLLNEVQNKGTQGVRARYGAELPPIISIVRYPGRPVISVPDNGLKLCKFVSRSDLVLDADHSLDFSAYLVLQSCISFCSVSENRGASLFFVVLVRIKMSLLRESRGIAQYGASKEETHFGKPAMIRASRGI